jgi:O-antigen ligase
MKRLNSDFFYRISGFGGMWAILGFPISVSLSQGGLFVAVLGWTLYGVSLRMEGSAASPRMRLHFDSVMLVALGIYGVELASLIFHAIVSDHPGKILFDGLAGELKDIWLLTAALWIYSYGSTEEGQKSVERYLLIAGIILVGSGFASFFSPYRLSRIPYHLTHGWEASAFARYQHHMATLLTGTPFEFRLYMPVGFMNTHLTYGALLSFFLPFILFRTLHTVIMNPSSIISKGGILRALLPVIVLIVAVLNNARSIMIGGALSLLIGIYYFTRVYWKRRVVLPAVIGGLLLIGSAGVYVIRQGDAKSANRAELLPFQEKHTDFQRIYLWESVMELIREEPFLGVGPGGFQAKIERAVLENARLNPGSWVDYMMIQRGHAHNDPLHLTAIAGPLAAALYFLFFALLVKRVLVQSEDMGVEFFKWGPISLLFGGLFQCYFQDDEVMLPFWLLVGYLLRRISERPVDRGAIH